MQSRASTTGGHAADQGPWCGLWTSTLASSGKCKPGLPANAAALVAVGGYGRAELLPHSDIDVLMLLPDGASTGTGSPLKAANRGLHHRVLGHGAGDRLVGAHRARVRGRGPARRHRADGHARVPPAWPAASACSSASWRPPAEAMDPAAFLRAKTLEMRQRHTKYEDTPYALEPNCKESPGGLRDLQLVIWVARAAGLGASWAAGRQGPDHAVRGQATAAPPRHAHPDPRPAACRGRAARGPPGV